jgi:hypothetical protein
MIFLLRVKILYMFVKYEQRFMIYKCHLFIDSLFLQSKKN